MARHAASISFSVISCNERRRIFPLFLVSDIKDRTRDVVRVFLMEYYIVLKYE